MDTQGDWATRRRVLELAGLGATAGVAGCLGGGGDHNYGARTSVDARGNGSLDNATEASAQEAFADQTPDPDAVSVEQLALLDHEPVATGGFKGLTVQGTVENTGEELIEYAEVRVRAFDGDTHLGTYLTSTNDLAGGTPWEFEVVVLEAPDDVTGYDAGVFGWPS